LQTANRNASNDNAVEIAGIRKETHREICPEPNEEGNKKGDNSTEAPL